MDQNYFLNATMRYMLGSGFKFYLLMEIKLLKISSILFQIVLLDVSAGIANILSI